MLMANALTIYFKARPWTMTEVRRTQRITMLAVTRSRFSHVSLGSRKRKKKRRKRVKRNREKGFIQPTLEDCCPRSIAIYKTSNPLLKLINMHNWRHPVILWPGLRKLFCGTLIILVRTPSYKYCQHCSLPSTKWKSGVWGNNCKRWGWEGRGLVAGVFFFHFSKIMYRQRHCGKLWVKN